MVVYFSVCRQYELSVVRNEGLLSRQGVNDGKTLVAQNGVAACVHAAPVRTAVPYGLAHLKHLSAKLFLESFVNRL